MERSFRHSGLGWSRARRRMRAGRDAMTTGLRSTIVFEKRRRKVYPQTYA
jgi:hypothetical protein